MNPSSKDKLYEHFFRGLAYDLCRERDFGRSPSSGKGNWRAFASGTPGFGYAVVFPRDRRVRAELYIDLRDRERNVAVYSALQAARSTLEREFGDPLIWEPLKNRRACRIAAYTQGTIEDSKSLDDYRRWMIERLLRFKNVFGPRLPGLTARGSHG